MERKKSNQEDTGFGQPNREAGWEEVQAVHCAQQREQGPGVLSGRKLIYLNRQNEKESTGKIKAYSGFAKKEK